MHGLYTDLRIKPVRKCTDGGQKSRQESVLGCIME